MPVTPIVFGGPYHNMVRGSSTHDTLPCATSPQPSVPQACQGSSNSSNSSKEQIFREHFWGNPEILLTVNGVSSTTTPHMQTIDAPAKTLALLREYISDEDDDQEQDTITPRPELSS